MAVTDLWPIDAPPRKDPISSNTWCAFGPLSIAFPPRIDIHDGQFAPWRETWAINKIVSRGRRLTAQGMGDKRESKTYTMARGRNCFEYYLVLYSTYTLHEVRAWLFQKCRACRCIRAGKKLGHFGQASPFDQDCPYRV